MIIELSIAIVLAIVYSMETRQLRNYSAIDLRKLIL